MKWSALLNSGTTLVVQATNNISLSFKMFSSITVPHSNSHPWPTEPVPGVPIVGKGEKKRKGKKETSPRDFFTRFPEFAHFHHYLSAWDRLSPTKSGS